MTGANKGIGRAIVERVLADHEDTSAIMACRSRTRCDEAVASLVSANPAWRERISVLEMDTSSDASVAAAAATLSAQLGSKQHLLYGIVNNAGIASGSLTEIFETNVRGPHRVDAAFLPLLDQHNGRVVQISSGAASMCLQKCSDERRRFFVDPKVTWQQIEGLMGEVLAFPNGKDDLEPNGIGASMGGYGLSKALLNSYTMALAAEHPNLQINSCSPGMIATDILGTAVPFIPNFIVKTVARVVMGAKTADEGTVSAMHLLFAKLEGNGRYYGSDGKRSPLDRYRAPGSAPYDGP